MSSAIVEGLKCDHCDHDPFKTRAALGSHVSAKHGLTLDGRKAPKRKSRRNDTTGPTYTATLHLGRRNVDVALTLSQVRAILADHPEDVLDAMLAA